MKEKPLKNLITSLHFVRVTGYQLSAIVVIGQVTNGSSNVIAYERESVGDDGREIGQGFNVPRELFIVGERSGGTVVSTVVLLATSGDVDEANFLFDVVLFLTHNADGSNLAFDAIYRHSRMQ